MRTNPKKERVILKLDTGTVTHLQAKRDETHMKVSKGCYYIKSLFIELVSAKKQAGGLQTAECGIGVKCRLRVKCRMRTTDFLTELCYHFH